MIHVLISKNELSEYLFSGLEGVDTIFVPIKRHNPLHHRFVKAIYYKVWDKVYSIYFPKEVVNRLRNIPQEDCLIVIGEDTYCFWMLSHLCKHVRNKVAYFWNPCFTMVGQKVNRKLQKQTDKPKAIVEYIRSLGFKVASFDKQDSLTYRIAYFPQFYRIMKKPVYPSSLVKYDFFFCGKEKGRGTTIENMHSVLSRIGRCKFIVVKGTLSDAIGYFEYLKIVQESKVICDVVQLNQDGLTLRALEALCFEKKCITNNTSIVNYDFYHPNNFLLLKNDIESSDIEEFLRLPYITIRCDIRNAYDVSQLLNNLSNLEN